MQQWTVCGPSKNEINLWLFMAFLMYPRIAVMGQWTLVLCLMTGAVGVSWCDRLWTIPRWNQCHHWECLSAEAAICRVGGGECPVSADVYDDGRRDGAWCIVEGQSTEDYKRWCVSGCYQFLLQFQMIFRQAVSTKLIAKLSQIDDTSGA